MNNNNIGIIASVILIVLFVIIITRIFYVYNEIKRFKKKEDENKSTGEKLKRSLSRYQFQDTIKQLSQDPKIKELYYKGLDEDDKKTINLLLNGKVSKAVLDDFFEDRLLLTQQESQLELEVLLDKELYNE